MVCCVYSGIQGDVGLPGPSGTPGDGSLRSEKTLTIYKGDKVTQQGKDREEIWTLSLHTHTCRQTQRCDGVHRLSMAPKEEEEQ